MKKKTYAGLLLVEAGLLVFLGFLFSSFPQWFSSPFAFPLEQVGLCLRFLSLKGGFGNILAIIVTLLLGLLPLFYYFIRRKKQKNTKEDFLLLLLSPTLLGVLYLLINPQYLLRLFATSPLSLPIAFFKGATVLAFYALLLTYGVFRLLHKVEKENLLALYKVMGFLILLTGVLLVAFIFGPLFSQYRAKITVLKQNDFSTTLSFNHFFLFLDFLVKALGLGLPILPLYLTYELFSQLKKDPLHHQNISLAQKLSKQSIFIVKTLVVLETTLLFLQLLFSTTLSHSNFSISFPISSLLLVVAILLFARYIEENIALKKENDSFI